MDFSRRAAALHDAGAEQLDLTAVKLGPRSGPGIEPADQPCDPLRRVGPADVRRLARELGGVGRTRVILPRRGRPSRSGLRTWPYATTTPTSGTRARRRARNAGSLGRSGCSTGTSSASAAVLTGVGTTVERERPWGLSGCVTTATTSNPSPSKAWREGTANSGVPKKTTRTQSSPAGSGVTSFTYPDWPLRDFFHLASSSPRFTALKWSRKRTPSR